MPLNPQAMRFRCTPRATTSSLVEDEFDEAGDERGSFGHGVDQHVLVIGVGAATDGAKAVERRHGSGRRQRR